MSLSLIKKRMSDDKYFLIFFLCSLAVVVGRRHRMSMYLVAARHFYNCFVCSCMVSEDVETLIYGQFLRVAHY